VPGRCVSQRKLLFSGYRRVLARDTPSAPTAMPRRELTEAEIAELESFGTG
jgi:hypothetical protein